VPYPEQSLASRLLKDDPEVLEQVLRWISTALTSPRFWSLRPEWPDLMQEVLARVVESLRQERFDASRDLRAYVQGTARFVSLQTLERRKDQPASAAGWIEDTEAGSGEAKAINRQLARRVMDAASEDCRELFRLYFFEERRYEEIAERQLIPVGTVKSRLFRCLECAHQCLQREKQGTRRRVARI
jgi:RNA polymerase sigma factor (sigma-70 family)